MGNFWEEGGGKGWGGGRGGGGAKTNARNFIAIDLSRLCLSSTLFPSSRLCLSSRLVRHLGFVI